MSERICELCFEKFPVKDRAPGRTPRFCTVACRHRRRNERIRAANKAAKAPTRDLTSMRREVAAEVFQELSERIWKGRGEAP